MIRQTWLDLLYALQFLTRIPVRFASYPNDALSRAVKFFPFVGLLVGGSAGLLYLLIEPHLPKLVAAAVVLTYLVLVTGCFHEDALADAADGFGGGWDREQVLLILRDSRIGSYGGTALALSLAIRMVLLSSLARAEILGTLIVAHVLCRWSTLPLSYFLPPARSENPAGHDGQGARVASLTTMTTLIVGTLFSFSCTSILLHRRALAPILAVTAVTYLSGLYYKRRIGGVTGDCFGATNQLAEVTVYICAVWAA